MLSNKKLSTQIYFNSIRIRMIELEISNRYKDQKMRCPVHLSVGQEFLPGIIQTFYNKNDKAVSGHRAHAHYLSKNCSLKKLIAEIYGKKTGCSGGIGGSMHLIDTSKGFYGSTAIVGNTIPIGAGISLSMSLKKNNNNITYIFFGDGAIETGVFYETLNFAVLKKLPCLFVCENNFFSVYSEFQKRQPKNRKIFKLASSFGIKSDFANTTNINQTFKKFNNAYNYVKNEQKPFFIEFHTSRKLEHCGPDEDDHLNYRKKKFLTYWKNNDPVKKLEKILLRKKILSLKKINLMKKKIKIEIYESFKFAEKSKPPTINDLNKDLFLK